MIKSPPHPNWIEDMKRISEETARRVVEEYQRKVVNEQIKKARAVVRDYSSVPTASGQIKLQPRNQGTVRIHSFLAVVGAASGTITVKFGNDQMVFPQNPPGGYIFIEGLDIFLGNGDERSLTIATPGNPLFFGIFGEQVGDSLWIA
jgi:hypothetical protein